MLLDAKTNEATHDIIRGGLDRSPMFSGVIEGTGPSTVLASRTKFTVLPIKIHIRFLEPEV